MGADDIADNLGMK